MPTKTTDAVQFANAELMSIDVDLLIPTPDNPRVFPKNDAKNESLLQLAESIRMDGVLEPLLARPHPDKTRRGKFDLRAGERRLRAAKLAGLKTVPVLVRPMSDQQAMRVTFAENDNQAPLHPLEQARAVKTLLDKGFTYEQIESEMRHSRRYLLRLVQLNNLSPKWRKLLSEHETVRQAFSGAHLEKIARHPRTIQDELLTKMNYKNAVLENPFGAAADLHRELRDFLHILDAAPWKKDDSALLPAAGSCANCEKRSDRIPELFDDDDFADHNGKVKKGARCLDSGCFDAKMRAFLEHKESELKQEHKKSVIITGEDWRLSKNDPYKKRLIENWRLKPCKPSDKDARPCLVVSGSEAGQVKWVKNPRLPAPEQSKKPREKSVDAKREELNRTRLAAMAQSLRDAAHQTKDRSEIEQLLVVTAVLESDYAPIEALAEMKYADAEELRCRAYALALAEMGTTLAWHHKNYEAIYRTFAWAVGCDYDALWAEVCKKHPEPASWAKDEAAEKTKKEGNKETQKKAKGKASKKRIVLDAG